MGGIDDFELDRRYEPVEETFDPYPTHPPPHRIGWLIAALVVVAVAAAVGYVVWKQRASVAPSAQPVAAAPPTATTTPAPAAPTITGDNIPLPPLPETDPLIRQLVTRLSSHPAVASWLATKGLLANFTVVSLNIAEGHVPTTHLRALEPRDRFRTAGSGSDITIDPRSYQRYDKYADAISSLDATGPARLYLTVKPRIADAYRELGYPDGDFDRVLERAIGELLKTPVVEGAVPLRQKAVTFAFADPRLESLSPAQKQFLRMGPRSVQTVQAKLREIATLLNLHPDGLSSAAQR